MNRILRRRLLWAGGGVASIGVIIVAIHFLLLRFDKGFAFVVFGRQVGRLGAARVSYFPDTIASAFDTVAVSKEGVVVRAPKYIHNVLVDYESDQVVYASELGSTEQKRYRFTNDTSYICASPRMVTVDQPEPVDPKKDLANYEFVFRGDGYRGDLMPESLSNFRQDLVSGDPAKLYLLKPTPDSDGTYSLVHVILFTSNPWCVNMLYEGTAVPNSP